MLERFFFPKKVAHSKNGKRGKHNTRSSFFHQGENIFYKYKDMYSVILDESKTNFKFRLI